MGGSNWSFVGLCGNYHRRTPSAKEPLMGLERVWEKCDLCENYGWCLKGALSGWIGLWWLCERCS